MRVGPQVTSYARRTNEMSSHSLHGTSQPNPHFVNQIRDKLMRNGTDLCRSGQPALSTHFLLTIL